MKNLPLAILIASLFLGAGLVSSAFSFRSDCVSAENGIKAQYLQNQNAYDSMWHTFREMSQVPENRAADIERVYRATMAGRYGADGNQAVFAAIREVNPQMDSALYERIAVAIEAGRGNFASNQTDLIDRVREYRTLLQGNRGLFLNWFGFPTVNLDQYNIVTSEATDTAFATGHADEIRLRD